MSDLLPGPYAPEPPDLRKLRDLKDRLRELRTAHSRIEKAMQNYDDLDEGRAALYRMFIGETPDMSSALRQNQRDQNQLVQKLNILEKPQRTPETYLDMLPRLGVGEAIYRAADGTVKRIKTPSPPPSLASVKKTSHAAYIKQRTNAQYGTNRTVDNPPSQPPENVSDLGEDEGQSIPPDNA